MTVELENTKSKTAKLVELVQQGNQNAFAELYDNYSAALFGVVTKIVKSEEVAGDVLQDAFVKIWRNINKYDSKKGSIFTWMLNISRNTAIDYYRKNSKMVHQEIQTVASDVSDKSKIQTNQNTDIIGISDKLDKLDKDYQFIIQYLYFEGYTQQEISDEFNIPLGTVKTRARTAIKKLKDYLTAILFWI